ncbi:MAG: antirestriction protein ArdA [Pseudomonadota bacterium]
MTRLHAQPYDISANGFYFESQEAFQKLAKANRNDYGDPVEEYKIQFIDGEAIDLELAKAIDLNQANYARFFDLVEELEDYQKVRLIIAMGECAYAVELNVEAIEDIDLDIYEIDTLKELAEQFVDEGLYGDIPDRLSAYLDYDAIARDLSIDYATTDIAGTTYAYRCA